jgi:hypothetical protein
LIEYDGNNIFFLPGGVHGCDKIALAKCFADMGAKLIGTDVSSNY